MRLQIVGRFRPFLALTLGRVLNAVGKGSGAVDVSQKRKSRLFIFGKNNKTNLLFVSERTRGFLLLRYNNVYTHMLNYIYTYKHVFNVYFLILFCEKNLKTNIKRYTVFTICFEKRF